MANTKPRAFSFTSDSPAPHSAVNGVGGKSGNLILRSLLVLEKKSSILVYNDYF